MWDHIWGYKVHKKFSREVFFFIANSEELDLILLKKASISLQTLQVIFFAEKCATTWVSKHLLKIQGELSSSPLIIKKM